MPYSLLFLFPFLFLFLFILPSNISEANPSTRSSNLFLGRRFYLNRNDYIGKVWTSIRTATPIQRKALLPFLKSPTAIWLSNRKAVKNSRSSVAAYHLKQASRMSQPTIVTFVVYNLPNRDCSATASFGELCCNQECNKFKQNGKCDYGLARYRNGYIDPLAKTVKRFCGRVPMAFVIEPDSFGNLVTNSEDPRCGSSTALSYREGVKYAVRKLHDSCKQASLYLDAAHGGWLGWSQNSVGFMKEVKNTGVWKLLRGFAINVANYNEMGVICPVVGFCLGGKNARHICCKNDACGLARQFNPGHTTLNYVMSLTMYAKQRLPGFNPKFIIDTSRNGVPGARQSCPNNCNIRGAGVGLRATTRTARPLLIDAYMWIKPPGESDGCTKRLPGGGLCKQFVQDCVSRDSIGTRKGEPRAPEAGQWFDYEVKMYAVNGRM